MINFRLKILLNYQNEWKRSKYQDLIDVSGYFFVIILSRADAKIMYKLPIFIIINGEKGEGLREQKAAIRITCFLSIVTIIASLISCKVSGYDSFYCGFALTVFGSALVSFFVSVITYFVKRKDDMEEFLDECDELFKQFCKIKHLEFIEPLELVENCLYAELNSESKHEEKLAAKDQLQKWFNENGSNEYEKKMRDMGWESFYAIRLGLYKRTLIQSAQSYILFSENRMRKLNEAYGKLDFLFGNKRIRQRVHREVYQKLYDMLQISKRETIYFDEFVEGESNWIFYLSKIGNFEKEYLAHCNVDSFKELIDRMNSELDYFQERIHKL